MESHLKLRPSSPLNVFEINIFSRHPFPDKIFQTPFCKYFTYCIQIMAKCLYVQDTIQDLQIILFRAHTSALLGLTPRSFQDSHLSHFRTHISVILVLAQSFQGLYLGLLKADILVFFSSQHGLYSTHTFLFLRLTSWSFQSSYLSRFRAHTSVVLWLKPSSFRGYILFFLGYIFVILGFTSRSIKGSYCGHLRVHTSVFLRLSPRSFQWLQLGLFRVKYLVLFRAYTQVFLKLTPWSFQGSHLSLLRAHTLVF